MYIPKKSDRHAFFTSLYENAKNCTADVADRLRIHYEQYKGSDVIDGSSERASAVRNITYELIESQVSSDIPSPKVDPRYYTPHLDRNAKHIECLCARLRSQLDLEEFNDMDERYTYIYGGSIWLVEWDSEKEEGTAKGGIRLTCVSPRDFIPQPYVYRLEDMEYCFLRFLTTREELIRRYGITREEAAAAQTEQEDAVRSDDDTVTVIVCYYRDEARAVCRYVWSGDAVLSDIEGYYGRKKKVCRKCGLDADACTCERPQFSYQDVPYETLAGELTDGEGRLFPPEEKENGERTLTLPYYRPKSFPIVIRRNTSCDKQLLGQSDCEYLRPEQQQINKVESRIMQKLMRSGITPMMPEDATVTLNNAVFGQVIRLRPGEHASDYGTVDTTPDIAQDIAQAERLYEHAKRIIGISDAYQGNDIGIAESGYARQIRISQAAGRLESKRRMKYAAYAALDRLIFEFHLAYADEPRPISFTDCMGNAHEAAFNRYDYLAYDPVRRTYYYDDAYLFSVDLSGGAEQQRENMWKRNLENLQNGSLGDPSSPSTLLRYWQSQERAHYPYARENVEYFRDLTRKGVFDEAQIDQNGVV